MLVNFHLTKVVGPSVEAPNYVVIQVFEWVNEP